MWQWDLLGIQQRPVNKIQKYAQLKPEVGKYTRGDLSMSYCYGAHSTWKLEVQEVWLCWLNYLGIVMV